MRVIIQKVSEASVSVSGDIVGKIKKGFLVFFAVHVNDEEKLISKMADKITNLRIFEDKDSKMNLALRDVKGEVLVVSQFTLYGDTRKGNRPSFIESARPEKAIPYYEKFISVLREKGFKVESGRFGEKMSVSLINDGPNTIIIDLPN